VTSISVASNLAAMTSFSSAAKRGVSSLGAVAEIGRDRLREAGLVLGDRRAQPLQPVEARLVGRRPVGARAIEHAMEGVLQGQEARALQVAFQGLVHLRSPRRELRSD
jgi:hypothetical protein